MVSENRTFKSSICDAKSGRGKLAGLCSRLDLGTCVGGLLVVFAVSTARARHASSPYMGDGAAHLYVVASEQARLPQVRRLGPHLIQRMDKALVRATLGSAYWVWFAGVTPLTVRVLTARRSRGSRMGWRSSSSES